MTDRGAPIRIAVDAMGGDQGPAVVVQGVAEFLRESKSDVKVVLVGDEAKVKRELAHYTDLPRVPEILHTTQEIDMSEKAASSLRKKRDSSIARGLQLQKDGQAAAFVSAGNTGAVVAASLLALGRLPGVRRPGIATHVPSMRGGYVLLDVGATKDCRPSDLVQFGQMGAVYAEHILGRENPRVGLLNIGEEENKGNELTREAYQLLLQADLNFVGNVESMGFFRGVADVAVCDGFVGNVVLKFVESVFEWMSELVREEVSNRPMAKAGAVLLRPVLKALKAQISYEQYGGAPLLGIDGITIICHGRSSPLAIANAIRMASRFVKHAINREIKTKLEAYQGVTVE